MKKELINPGGLDTQILILDLDGFLSFAPDTTAEGIMRRCWYYWCQNAANHVNSARLIGGLHATRTNPVEYSVFLDVNADTEALIGPDYKTATLIICRKNGVNMRPLDQLLTDMLAAYVEDVYLRQLTESFQGYLGGFLTHTGQQEKFIPDQNKQAQ